MNETSKIKKIKAREILDSRGNPTVEVKLETKDGIFISSVPSGASTGKREAIELRDKGKRYLGKGVSKAVKNVNEIIGPKLKGKNPVEQREIDKKMIELDGTENKSNLGANAILAVSMAVCRAGAATENVPLYKHISNLFKWDENKFYAAEKDEKFMPVPCFNIINGGAHAGNNLDIQEFMVIPQESCFSEKLRAASEIYHNLKKIIEKKYGKQAINVGDEGGFAPPISKAEEALDLISKAIKIYPKTKIGIDCAASQFYKNKKYRIENKVISKDKLLSFYGELVKKYPIIFLEDPFSENDGEGFKKITEEIGRKISIIGDDFLTTNPKIIKEAGEERNCNGAIIKPNQIGTVSETLEAAKLAKSFWWKIIVSHRSGDTCDNFIADLAVGIKADYIKSGAPCREERLAKYNRLLEIEKEIEL